MRLNVVIFGLVFLFSCTDDDTKVKCSPNVNIGIKASTANSVTLKWIETQGFGSNFEYGDKGFVLGTGTKGNTTEEEITIENLEKGKQYDFYLQSLCGNNVEGNWIATPYSLSIPLNCPLLATEDIGVYLDIENKGFRFSWNSSEDFKTWEVELVDSGESIGTGIRVESSNTNAIIPNVPLPKIYDVYIRGKCIGEDNFGEWVKKPLGLVSGHGLDGSYYCGDVFIQQYTWEFLEINPVFTSGSSVGNDNFDIEIEFIEEGMEIGTGLQFLGYYYYIRRFENDFNHNVIPNTRYNIYARTICYETIYGEWTYLDYNLSASCNDVYFIESRIDAQNLILSWSNSFGFNQEFRAPYDNYTFQIEYGVQGFDHGTGVVIDINDQNRFSYEIPLVNLQSGITYEFFVRTKCNDLGYSSWNDVGGRLLIDVP